MGQKLIPTIYGKTNARQSILMIGLETPLHKILKKKFIFIWFHASKV